MIAAIALAVGVWENVQMRAHNRLSVTPHLALTAEFHNADADSVGQGIIRVSNEGVGPAVIDRIDVLVTGDDGTQQQFATWGDARLLLEDLLDANLARRVELGDGVMLGVDRSHDLAIFEKSLEADESLFPALLDRLDLRISYHSVYGEPYEADLGGNGNRAGT